MPSRIFGSSLRVGDTIETWWPPKQDVITQIVPYTGPVPKMREERWTIAYFAQNQSGMLIDPGFLFDLVSRAPRPPTENHNGLTFGPFSRV